jgi:pyrroline-5-carboxylate reductase
MPEALKVAILGAGQIGTAIAKGFVAARQLPARDIVLTRRRAEALRPLSRAGFRTTTSNADAVAGARVVIVAVPPANARSLLQEIAGALEPRRQIVVSVVTGLTLAQISELLGSEIPTLRATPNIAVAIRESMTCIAASPGTPREAKRLVASLFGALGRTAFIPEELMLAATALCACGTAFFLRCIRAASQGGVEIGFQAEEAVELAAQTALGAARLVLENRGHPEQEIDKVTTPRGITISGLNQMEHHGFSSAMIRGIVTAAEKAAHLLNEEAGRAAPESGGRASGPAKS